MRLLILGLVLFGVLILTACNGSDKDAGKSDMNDQNNGLTDFQQKNGIGPITQKITLNNLDPVKIENGKATFTSIAFH